MRKPARAASERALGGGQRIGAGVQPVERLLNFELHLLGEFISCVAVRRAIAAAWRTAARRAPPSKRSS